MYQKTLDDNHTLNLKIYQNMEDMIKLKFS